MYRGEDLEGEDYIDWLCGLSDTELAELKSDWTSEEAEEARKAKDMFGAWFAAPKN